MADPIADLYLYTVRTNRTWDITDKITGMVIYTVTGKRRRRALMSHLESLPPADWQTHRVRAYAWATEHPRG